MNKVIGEFARLNAEKEIHYQYLQTLNENINVAFSVSTPMARSG
jgi:hypothetical protein